MLGRNARTREFSRVKVTVWSEVSKTKVEMGAEKQGCQEFADK
jgi:hypothetical protein